MDSSLTANKYLHRFIRSQMLQYMQDFVFVPNMETMNKISIAHNKCDVFKNKKDKL